MQRLIPRLQPILSASVVGVSIFAQAAIQIKMRQMNEEALRRSLTQQTNQKNTNPPPPKSPRS